MLTTPQFATFPSFSVLAILVASADRYSGNFFDLEITCSPCSDMGKSQIMEFFGISHNFLGVIYFEGVSNEI